VSAVCSLEKGPERGPAVTPASPQVNRKNLDDKEERIEDENRK
jgi:hypothetical protein